MASLARGPEHVRPAPPTVPLAHDERWLAAACRAGSRPGTRQGADLRNGRWHLGRAENRDLAAPLAVLLAGHEGVITPRRVLIVTAGDATSRSARHRADLRVPDAKAR